MKKFIGVLLFIWAGCWLVSCAITDDGAAPLVRELTTTGFVPGCAGSEGPAVSITVNNILTNLPLTGLKIRYRINGGDWSREQETVEIPFIINGPAGKYEIEVRKEGFPHRTAIIEVPQEDNCGVLQQEWNTSIEQPLCLPPLPVVVMDLVAELPNEEGLEVIVNTVNGYQNNGLSVTLKTPGDAPQTNPCNSHHTCHVNIEFDIPGDYVVEFAGFQDYRKMRVIDDIVHYAYSGVRIELNAGVNRNKTIVSEGVSNMSVTIPYKFGDSGCHEVLFDRVDVETNHVESSYPHTIETRENMSYRIESYPSLFCPEQPPNNVNFIKMDYDVLLPTGTRTTDVRVEYWLDNGWHQASCNDDNGYQCTVMYPNPLYGGKYQVRTFIKDQEYMGTSVSLGDKCIVFGQSDG